MRIQTLALWFGALLCAASPLAAQSNEIALQVGRTVFEGRRIDFSGLPGEAFEEENGLAGGIVYNRKVLGGNGASLHFHLPLFAFEDQLPEESRFDQRNIDTSRMSAFITPGVMIRLFEPFFLQPYVFGGVGYARIARLTPTAVSGSLPTARITLEDEGTWGVSMGGGVDVMLGRHFGIRGEVRGLTAGGKDTVIPGLTLDEPGTRWAATAGLAFRF